MRALTCKDKDGDESGSAVAHDIYKAQWAKIQKKIWIAIQRKETLTIRLKLSYYLFEHGAFFKKKVMFHEISSFKNCHILFRFTLPGGMFTANLQRKALSSTEWKRAKLTLCFRLYEMCLLYFFAFLAHWESF